MTHFDHSLFLALNFDGGPCWDRVMLTLSGTAVWIPLYLLIIWLVLRRTGWRGLLLFLVLMAAAVGLADITAGIFKHNGLLGNLLPGLEPRWRPMFTPSLEGLDIAPDSLRTLRRLTPEALHAAQTLGYPVLLRTSYVIGGQNMQIVRSDTEALRYMERILAGGIENPVLVDKYMMGPELEVDVISDGRDVLILSLIHI